MSTGCQSLDPRALDQAREFLRHHVAGTPNNWGMYLPALHQVHVTHIEDGWVQLCFTGYRAAQAKALADDLLLPDSVLVASTDTDCVFEGFAALDEPPPAPVPAASGPTGDTPPQGWSGSAAEPPRGRSPAIEGEQILHLGSSPPPDEQ